MDYELPFRLSPYLALVPRVTGLAGGVANALDDYHDSFAIVADLLAEHASVRESAARGAVESGAESADGAVGSLRPPSIPVEGAYPVV